MEAMMIGVLSYMLFTAVALGSMQTRPLEAVAFAGGDCLQLPQSRSYVTATDRQELEALMPAAPAPDCGRSATGALVDFETTTVIGIYLDADCRRAFNPTVRKDDNVRVYRIAGEHSVCHVQGETPPVSWFLVSKIPADYRLEVVVNGHERGLLGRIDLALDASLTWSGRRTPKQLLEPLADTSGVTCWLNDYESYPSALSPVKARGSILECLYGSGAAAAASFNRFLATADPDRGHSYEWEGLIVTGRRLVRFVGACVLTRDQVDRAVQHLADTMQTETGTPARVARCRCGGGCSSENGHQP
jgi:hypothetical protein